MISAPSWSGELVAPEELVRLRTDEHRLEQVIANLVSNAVKFTHQGTVTLKLSAANGHPTQVEIIDTGIGIQPDKLRAIFEPFRQARRLA